MISLDELIELVPGEVRPDAPTSYSGVSTLESASESEIAFLFSKKHRAQLQHTKAGLVITEVLTDAKVPQLKTKDVRRAQFLIMSRFYDDKESDSQSKETVVHPSAVIHTEAIVHESVSVGPNTTIGSGVTVAENTHIGSNVVLYEGCQIGSDVRIDAGVVVYSDVKISDRVIIKSNAVLGSDGFGFFNDEGTWRTIPQIGSLVIESDVQIGACTTIDKGSIEDTLIKKGAKIDNMVHIAHNCVIGQHTAIAANVGFSGSTIVGDHVMIGGQAGFAGHLKVGDKAIVFARSGVTKDIPDGAFVSGFPAQDHKEEMGFQAKIRRFFTKK
tara:strand:- start:2721 stop:3704 length:984 start_codon:yes stop_codon:yes gene_type:complete